MPSRNASRLESPQNTPISARLRSLIVGTVIFGTSWGVRRLSTSLPTRMGSLDAISPNRCGTRTAKGDRCSTVVSVSSMYSLTKRATIAFGQTAIRSSAQPLAAPVLAALARAVQAPTPPSPAVSSALTTGRALKRGLESFNSGLGAFLARSQIRSDKIKRSVHFGRVVKIVKVDRSGGVSLCDLSRRG